MSPAKYACPSSDGEKGMPVVRIAPMVLITEN
jgi:hypothetical protein